MTVTIPRPAASLLVIRDSTEILMARRSATARFMPNVLVFPGGAVDPQDYHAKIATPFPPTVRVRLERSASPDLAQALGVAAARELTEEVGLSLGDPPALAGLNYLCRAITPAESPIRFDAYFFMVDAAEISGALAASIELEDPAWYSVEAALEANIARATHAILRQYQRFLSRHDREGPVPVLRERQWVYE